MQTCMTSSCTTSLSLQKLGSLLRLNQAVQKKWCPCPSTRILCLVLSLIAMANSSIHQRKDCEKRRLIAVKPRLQLLRLLHDHPWKPVLKMLKQHTGLPWMMLILLLKRILALMKRRLRT